jgi:hypothetical protein
MLGLLEIFYAPGKVFETIREKRIFIWALLANLLVLAGVYYYSVSQIGASNIARRQMETSRFAAQMPAEQKEKAIADADQPSRLVIGAVSTVVIVGIVFLVIALLYMAIAGMSGGPIKFSQALGTESYAAWPFTVLTAIVSIVVIMMAPDKTELDPQHLLAFNVGAFLDKATTSKFLYNFASSIDVIRLAGVVFAAWGLSIVAKIAFGKSLTGLLLVWFVFSLIGAGLASLFM